MTRCATAYLAIKTSVSEAIANGGFDLIIVDEATHYKNAQTKRWKTLNALLTPDKWLWMMTGTPAAQSPLDAYGIAKLVNQSAVPRFFGSFRDRVMTKITNFRWVPKDDATDTVYRVLQPAIRFEKDQCLDLPDVTHVERDAPLTKQQEKYYIELKKQLMMEADGEYGVQGRHRVLKHKPDFAATDSAQFIIR